MNLAAKIKQVTEISGQSWEDLLEDATIDSIATGICTNPNCDFTNDVEPDCTNGYCEECKTNTVQSVLIIAGII